MSNAYASGLFAVIALLAAGFLVYFLIDAKDKREEQDDEPADKSLPQMPTPEKYRFPGEHPGRPGVRPKGGGGGPHEPL